VPSGALEPRLSRADRGDRVAHRLPRANGLRQPVSGAGHVGADAGSPEVGRVPHPAVSGLASVWLVVIFLAAAAAIWVAGIQLSNTTDALDTRLGLGSALGGLILLAFATNLPEIVITVTAAASGHLDLAVGNLLGGIAIQTAVLAVLDGARGGERPLTFLGASLVLVLEAGLVIACVVAGLMTSQLPAKTNVLGVSPGTLGIVVLWLAGLVVIRRAQRGLPWQAEAIGSAPGRSRPAKTQGTEPQAMKTAATTKVAAIFALAAVVTAVAGILIEESGSELASRLGLSGAVFGATVLAATTALPEISTGLQSVKIGDHQLAFSDIFGGNAFLMVVFLLADLVGGTPALPQAHDTDLWMAGLGVVLTAIYLAGLVIRPQRRIARLGADSIAVVGVYAIGIAGLVLIAR
jgi:cation:H+ antiporter